MRLTSPVAAVVVSSSARSESASNVTAHHRQGLQISALVAGRPADDHTNTVSGTELDPTQADGICALATMDTRVALQGSDFESSWLPEARQLHTGAVDQTGCEGRCA